MRLRKLLTHRIQFVKKNDDFFSDDFHFIFQMIPDFDLQKY